MSRHRRGTPARLPDPIYRPDLQGRINRGLFALLSAVGWLVWLYLFAPLLSLAAWGLGYRQLDLYVLSSTPQILLTLGVYAGIITLAGMLLLLWALYNLGRFGALDRRSAPAPVSDADLAHAFHISEAQVQELHTGRVLRLHHDAAGHITSVETVTAAEEGENVRERRSGPGR